MKITKFEDLQCWQKARTFVNMVYGAIRNSPNLFISKSSATEVQSEAYVASDQKYISREIFEKIYNQAETVSKLNSGFITNLF